ncbi:hypothetical protein GCM10007420_08310 [Glycocaulis albus]|uniref:Uncharacterized protein n=2 Tax=Glycocaulis albus TaxID=1382801 RepID=A0ABQ1XJB2_9PROT|nr:hypothetical protein GCM10007420_08310 [Glycocaulis albus]
MHMAIGSTIAAALTGLAASTAVTLAGPQTDRIVLTPASAAPASAPGEVRVQLAQGEAYLDQIHYAETGSPAAFTVRLGARSRMAGRFLSTLPVRVDASDVRFDAARSIAFIPYAEDELLARQAASGIPVAAAHAPELAGAPVITDRGHRFGLVERIAQSPGTGLVLMVRINGAGGGLQQVPASCAAQVPETGLVVVRTCNLDTL